MIICGNEENEPLVRAAFACYLLDAYANPTNDTMRLCVDSALKKDYKEICNLLTAIKSINIHVSASNPK